MSEQAEKPTSTEAPKTSGTQHNPAEVNNNIGWATKLARLATKLVRWAAPGWLPIGWIGNRWAELAGLANEPPIGNRGTQNIQSDHGKQANNSGTQYQPHYNSGKQANNSGTQNIQGDHGKQANNSGTQQQPNFAF